MNYEEKMLPYEKLCMRYKLYNESYDIIVGGIADEEEEIKLIQVQNTNRKNQLSNLIHQIQTKYRRAQNVKFFDEILEEWNK